MTILIADDDPTCSLILQRLLVKWGHDVVAVSDGSAAIRTLTGSAAPLLAILDWEMPGATGPDVCRKVRAMPIAQPYIFLLTAREGTESIGEGINSGANDYLIKPLDPSELRIRLDIARSIQERTAELAIAHTNNDRVLASIPCILIGLDAKGNVIQWNRYAEKTFSLSVDEVMGRHLSKLNIRWEDPTIPAQVLSRIQCSQTAKMDGVTIIRPNQSSVVLNLAVATILCPSPETPMGILVLGQDCTEERLLRMQLSQAQKLESLGQLAAGIAHEINTPIQYIGDNTNFLAGAFDDIYTAIRSYRAAADPLKLTEADRIASTVELDYVTDEIPKTIRQTLEGVQHVARIVRAMKEFAHPGAEDKSPIDLNRAVETVMEVTRNEWKFVAEVVTDFDPSLPLVLGLPGELNQVLLNLIINAAHAIRSSCGEGGKPGRITLATHWAGNYVEVRVSDTGCGIPEPIRSRVFDPFFTTKPVGKGTGQGLSIAHAVVVQRHGGSITFETETGRGTTFLVRLPLEISSVTVPIGIS